MEVACARHSDCPGIGVKHSNKTAEQRAQLRKIEAFGEQPLLIEDLGGFELLRGRWGLGRLVDKLGHGLVGLDGDGRNGRAEHQAFEGFAATQGHVDLAVGKGGPGVDDGPVKGEALAFSEW